MKKPKLNKIKHLRERMAERGATAAMLRIVRKYGETCSAGHIMLTARYAKWHIARLQCWQRRHKSATVVRRKLMVKQLVREIERMTNWLLVINVKTNLTVTAYPANEPKQIAFARGYMRPYIPNRSQKKGK